MVSDKNIFQGFILTIYFMLYDLDMERTETIWTIIKEGYIRIIPVKFGQNPASSLGRDVLWSNCLRHTTHDGHQMIAFNSPWAKDSGELKKTKLCPGLARRCTSSMCEQSLWKVRIKRNEICFSYRLHINYTTLEPKMWCRHSYG